MPWLRNAVAEAIGVFALCFVGILAINNLGAVPGGLVGIAFAHGLAIAVMVAALGHVSGGHFNPAITIGLLIARKVDAVTAGVYLVAQLLGGLIAALVVAGSFSTEVVSGGTPALGEGVGVGVGILLEAVATFFLVLTVFGTAVDKRAPASVYPFAIGLSITAGILAIGPFTGAALNPARWFGPALVGPGLTDGLVWIVGPILGGVAAALVHEYVLGPPQPAAEPVAESGERREV
jgi:MIP family channel proteins